MLDVPVPEVGLQGARVVPLVGQSVATGVPEDVRVGLVRPQRQKSPVVHPIGKIRSGLVVFPKDAPWLADLEAELFAFPTGATTIKWIALPKLCPSNTLSVIILLRGMLAWKN
jgi:hypothetical protein